MMKEKKVCLFMMKEKKKSDYLVVTKDINQDERS